MQHPWRPRVQGCFVAPSARGLNSVATVDLTGYVLSMVKIMKPAPAATLQAEGDLTAEQNAALMQSVARGRVQFEAGEGIAGKDVSRWLQSWGIAEELPAPTRKSRKA